jgi:hypothetical protein
MSSTNVVFTVCYYIPYHTKNKPLVLEWPTFIDVNSLPPPTRHDFKGHIDQDTLSRQQVFTCVQTAQQENLKAKKDI